MQDESQEKKEQTPVGVCGNSNSESFPIICLTETWPGP